MSVDTSAPKRRDDASNASTADSNATSRRSVKRPKHNKRPIIVPFGYTEEYFLYFLQRTRYKLLFIRKRILPLKKIGLLFAFAFSGTRHSSGERGWWGELRASLWTGIYYNVRRLCRRESTKSAPRPCYFKKNLMVIWACGRE